jgi:ferredoxin/DMSO/TMAO reductase YedYZ heme-binding membrane subunit
VRDAAQSVHLVAATAGFFSYALLWATVIWGIMLRRGWASQSTKYSNLYATHMTLSIVGLTLGWIHALTQLANPTGTVFLVDEFIPFSNYMDPIGIGVGVLGTEIMTALMVSVAIQRRLGYERWRAIHVLAYAAFTLVAGHILLSGSDVGPLYVKIPVVAAWASTIVVWLTGARSGRGESSAAPAEREIGAEVSVDPARCSRFGFCEQEAPAVFNLRKDGRLAYKTNVPPEHVAAAARAAKVCPARAIKMRKGVPVSR